MVIKMAGRFVVRSWVVAGLILAGCSTEGGSPKSPPPTTASPEAAFVLVALGDSDATGEGDPTGEGWVGRYAKLVEGKAGRTVDVRQHAQNGQTTEQLMDNLESDDTLKKDLAEADFIVIGIGGADLTVADDAYLAGSCKPEKCYRDALATFRSNFADIVGAIADLKGSKPTVLRAVTLPNVVPGAEDVIPADLVSVAKRLGRSQAVSLRESTCAAVREHGGECADVLTAINGPSGDKDGYAAGLLNHDNCCYPNTKGQQLMAKLLFDLGVDPVELK